MQLEELQQARYIILFCSILNLNSQLTKIFAQVLTP